MVAIVFPWMVQSDDDYLHLERYVNDGSPSGFTEVHKTSLSADPFTGDASFPLLQFDDSNCDVVRLGAPCIYFDATVNFVHPDSIDSSTLARANRSMTQSSLIVSPVAGGRTMLVRNSEKHLGYIKLTYDVSRIGRVDRQLSLQHCLSSIEMSETLTAALDSGALGNRCALLREPSARVTMLSTDCDTYEWGTIFRERAPYPYISEKCAIVPGFSLFGRDRKDSNHENLVCQFIKLGGYDPRAYLIDLLLSIIDSYWKIVISTGLHIECHGQNCLFEVTSDLKIRRFVVKDMDSVDKDLPLQKFLGVRSDWKSYPYMCMDENIYYYSIRSSYMYDFKLGEYLLDPIIMSVCSEFELDSRVIEADLRDHVRACYVTKLPPWYFPADGCWYDCDNTERLPGTRREYFAHSNPRFR